MAALDPAVRLFGLVTVVVGTNEVALGRGKPGAVLAVLALEPGRVVRLDTLVDALWGERPPPSARALVHTYISTLRRFLAELDDGAPLVETAGGGYRLGIGPEQVDVHRLLGLVGHTGATVEELQGGLDVSAEPLLFAADDAFVESWRLRIESARAAVQDRVWGARIDRGEAASVIPGLQAAVHAQPLRENIVLLLVEAFAASGRQEEAFATLDAYRLRLAEELGLDPSPRLIQVRQRLLSDSRLMPPAAMTNAEPPPADAPTEPPRRPRWSRRPGRLVVAVVTAATMVSGVVVIVVDRAAGRDEGTALSGPGLAVLVLEATSADVRTRLPLPIDPSGVEASEGLVWVRSEADRALAVLPVTGQGQERVVGLSQPPTDLAASGRSAAVGLGYSGEWMVVAEDRRSPPQAAVSGTAGRLALASHADELWVTTLDGQIRALAGVDQAGPKLTAKGAPLRMAVDDTRIWLVTFDRRTLVAVNRSDGTEVSSPLRGEPVDLAAEGGDAWAVTRGDDRLWRATATDGRVVATRQLPGPPAGVAVGSDRVWVAIRQPAALVSYDRATLDLVDSLTLGQEPAGLTTLSGLLVLAVR